MSDQIDNDALAIRAKPKPVRRFNRNALMGAAAVAILFVAGVGAYALRDPATAHASTATELYNTSNKPLPDSFESLPKSYRDVPTQLGPPLPGDLGAAMIEDTRVVATHDNPFQFVPASTPQTSSAGQSTYSAQDSLSDVRQSGLFFIEPGDRSRGGQARIDQALVPNPLDQLAALTLATNQVPTPGIQQTNEFAGQDRKAEFLASETDERVYNPYRIQEPISPYQVMAGTVIPASLVTGLNSDLPGQVIAQVTENVYDTPTGQHLLIPQGARLLGRYDSAIAYGQSRALMVWTRIIMPDGSSITIENLPGVDLSGYAGVEDRVDNHTWKIFQAAILSSVLSIGAELGRDSNDDEIVQALRDGGQRTLNQAGQRIVDRQLNVQPTITVRPGWRLRVIVNKDLVLQPYGG